ncbi:MAG TPA: UbiA family prenyltransferase [Allosphingosinicella sp.]
MARLSALALFVPHLRLAFQLTLAPIFLWGALLSGGKATWGSLAAFFSLHLFLYPAATAFNAVYDKDEGPIGGMEAPPPVPDGLRGFAILLAAAGAVPAAFAGPAFLLLYGLSIGWSFPYSHPGTRWKSGPWSSAAAIGLGQGAIGFAAGWAAAAPLGVNLPLLLAGAASAALTALGLYPVTQFFQAEEDRARGDISLSVALGPARALRFGALCLAAAGAVSAAIVAWRLGPYDALVVAAGYAGAIAWQLRLARALGAKEAVSLYRPAMRLLNSATAGFLLFLVWQALAR